MLQGMGYHHVTGSSLPLGAGPLQSVREHMMLSLSLPLLLYLLYSSGGDRPSFWCHLEYVSAVCSGAKTSLAYFVGRSCVAKLRWIAIVSEYGCSERSVYGGESVRYLIF
jgi:hypothetical protein